MSYIGKYVGSGSTTHAGLASIQRALGQGMSIKDIRKASQNQGFLFGRDARTFMESAENSQMMQDRIDQEKASINQQIAAQEAAQRRAEAVQAERLRQMEISERTKAANTARANLQSQFQIQSGSESPKTSGTQGFKRRKLQVNPTAYKSIATGLTKQTPTSGVINV